MLVRSHRPGVLSSFSATRLLLWKESGFWFAFGTRPFPSISEAWLSLLRGAAASCWDPGWRAGDGCGGAGPGALCLNSPWPSAFPSLLCSSFPLRWLYPPVVFSALPETMWLFSQNGNPWRVTASPLQAWKSCSVLSIPGEKITQGWNFSLAETQGSLPVFPLLVTFTFPTWEGEYLFVLSQSFVSWSFVCL